MFLKNIQDYCKKMGSRDMNEADITAIQLLDRKKQAEMVKDCPQETHLIMEGHIYFVKHVKQAMKHRI